MRFPPLPPSLLSLSPLSLLLLLVSAAAIPPTTSTDTSPPPPTGAELTPDNFQREVGQGLWFVEHFSPYCGHCKHFKPTWEQLVREGESELPGVRMGTVDCIMHGDLCDENGVKAYPTLFLFEDGKKVEEFKGSRDLDKLKTFLKRHIPSPPSPPSPNPPSSPPAKSRPKPPSHPSHPPLNPSGLVLPLTTSSFTPTLARGPTFIKFFAPWCGHCKKLAPTWRNLAKHMQGRVTIAEVNCDEESGLCKEQGVQGYPTLMWYPGGGGDGGKGVGKSEYSSGRRLEQLKAFVEKASAGGVQVLEKDEDLEKQVAEDDVVYLLLHSPSDTEILETIREASAPLLGSPQILASSSPSLFAKYSIPSIPSSSSSYTLLALKDHDLTTPVSLFQSSSASSPSSQSTSSSTALQQWLLTHRLPTTLELTQDTFQGVMNAPQKPLVVIFAAPEGMKEKVMQRLRDVGSKWKVRTQTQSKGKGDGKGKGEVGEVHGRQVVFAWMDSGRWGEWMKNMYGIVAPSGEGESEGGKEGGLEDVKVVIADHSRLIYYDTDHLQNPLKATSSASIFAALDDAASGLTPYHHSEGPIERVARYLNTKLTSLEEFITTSPLKALALFALVLVVVFWVLNRAIGNEVVVSGSGSREEAQRGWSKQKGRNGRLD